MHQAKRQIALVHATMNSVQPIVEAFQEHAPHVKLLHFLDEGLISELNETGVVSESMVRRLVGLMERAEQSRAEGIMLTCSSFTPQVNGIKHLFSKPVLSADYSMLEHAVKLGKRIGVIATVQAAGPTTTGLIQEIAGREGADVHVETIVLTEAFDALQAGDPNKHDQLIGQRIHEMESRCDVIVLAQMSMARVLKQVPKGSVPVLTSPEISVKSMLSVLSCGD
ncbi:aspartate/glutamate racemase family protein [Paenibacillus hamazuiensis]|uniref:aspartate/glutamate racemase family protein n=1 Tax=Paenibacillus hamazuiensis TaxID=2936508 RepID=UPI00200FF562|nr:aspartate/glutamate racemase family protein [Paenibacillus hamazuiensis]